MTPMIHFFHVSGCHGIDALHHLQPGGLWAELLLFLLLFLEPLHPEEWGLITRQRRRSHVIQGASNSPVGGAYRVSFFDGQVPSGSHGQSFVGPNAGQNFSDHLPAKETDGENVGGTISDWMVVDIRPLSHLSASWSRIGSEGAWPVCPALCRKLWTSCGSILRRLPVNFHTFFIT